MSDCFDRKIWIYKNVCAILWPIKRWGQAHPWLLWHRFFCACQRERGDPVNWPQKKPETINRVIALPIDRIISNPNQPRTNFDPEGIDELARSIAANGLLQPITVRDTGEGSYELIAGERRLLAYQSLGQGEIPAIVLDIPTHDSAVLALVENLHRADLSFFEEAKAMTALMDKLHLTQQQLARLLCKSQPAVANKLRLLRLPEEVCGIITKSGLTERHARALLSLNDMSLVKQTLGAIIKQNLNVAQTEAYIERLLADDRPKKQGVVIVRDVRLLFNSISRAVEIVKQSGFQVETRQSEDDDYVNYLVRIPKTSAYHKAGHRPA